eukprot:TRINITY_DN3165_c0_g2_i22.p1 TRINITY_DN3165_c0_g2~~TRINITY_DN3165_c0_g2_i22.p1  ORF type:complete len:582 (-),score=157.61 TRINITY_DN3165_c0_g2_i22:61-1713(-)
MGIGKKMESSIGEAKSVTSMRSARYDEDDEEVIPRQQYQFFSNFRNAMQVAPQPPSETLANFFDRAPMPLSFTPHYVMETDTSKLIPRMEKLEQEVKDEKKKVQRAERRERKALDTLTEMNVEYAEYKRLAEEKIANLGTKVELETQELARLREDKSTLQSDLEESKRNAEELRNLLLATDSRHEKAYEHLNDEVVRQKKINEELTRQNEQLKRDMQALRIANEHATADAVAKSVRQLKDEFDRQLDKSTSAFRQDSQKTSDLLTTTTSKLEKANYANDILNDQIDQLRENLQKRDEEIKKLEQANEKMRKKIEANAEDTERKLVTHVAAREEFFNEQVTRLEVQLNNEKDRNRELFNANERLKDQVLQARVENEGLKEKLNHAENELLGEREREKTLVGNIEALKRKFHNYAEQLQDTISEGNKRNYNLSQKIAVLESQLRIAESKLREYEAFMKGFQKNMHFEALRKASVDPKNLEENLDANTRRELNQANIAEQLLKEYVKKPDAILEKKLNEDLNSKRTAIRLMERDLDSEWDNIMKTIDLSLIHI